MAIVACGCQWARRAGPSGTAAANAPVLAVPAARLEARVHGAPPQRRRPTQAIGPALVRQRAAAPTPQRTAVSKGQESR